MFELQPNARMFNWHPLAINKLYLQLNFPQNTLGLKAINYMVIFILSRNDGSLIWISWLFCLINHWKDGLGNLFFKQNRTCSRIRIRRYSTVDVFILRLIGIFICIFVGFTKTKTWGYASVTYKSRYYVFYFQILRNSSWITLWFLTWILLILG